MITEPRQFRQGFNKALDIVPKIGYTLFSMITEPRQFRQGLTPQANKKLACI